MSKIVDLNVGGVYYSTSLETLQREPESLFTKLFTVSESSKLIKDSQGRYFIDRDGHLFRYIIEYLRNDCKLILPDNFNERDRLKCESDHFQLNRLSKSIASAPPGNLKPLSLVPSLTSPNVSSSSSSTSPTTISTSSSSIVVNSTNNQPANPSHSPISTVPGQISGYITIGYRGSFGFGKDGLADVKFRKLTRILVAGKVILCREVFGDTLNESRDPDHTAGQDRYTSRFYLKHQILEQAFDALMENGFRCVASCGSGTSGGDSLKPGVDAEENRWNHYNEFVFTRP
ncbi:BTB/POZ domain-containing protein KCTD12-like [Panonychus citri]|uniref:BTB/POZ domain-containing protein KCTD12-like n=1 Tax=Panonychus citri TaxID=50023 RepID=UPI002307E7B5|nr:BTB/POZ domain-containing protein KCTD12-like [Panonychus citri]